MATTKTNIRKWFNDGKDMENTHMIVATDIFSYEDFPVYVNVRKDINKEIKKYSNKNKMLMVMEVYNYSMNLEKQLNEDRAYNK